MRRSRTEFIGGLFEQLVLLIPDEQRELAGLIQITIGEQMDELEQEAYERGVLAAQSAVKLAIIEKELIEDTQQLDEQIDRVAEAFRFARPPAISH